MRREAKSALRTKAAKKTRIKGLRLEPLEQRHLLAADLVISEILASNGTGLEDEDGQRSDWMEIFNAGTTTAELGGWYLTDDAANMTKWQFPDVSLGAGKYLVVFASGKNRIDPASPLHTNFSLSAAGEYLALVEADGVTVGFDFAPAFPEQRSDISHGLEQTIEETTLVESGAAATALVPTDGSLGTAWTEIGFDDAGWITGTTGIGYERAAGYAHLIGTDVETQMFGISESVYVRIPFTVEDPSETFALTLRMKYDDGFAAYLNGEHVVSRNAPTVLEWNSGATAANSDGDAINFEDVDLTEFAGLLVEGDNVLAIHGLNFGDGGSDMLILPELTSSTANPINVDQRLFFAVPSPMLPNGVGYFGLVDDTSFDVDRGFFDQPFDVAITTETPGATIRYTLDGSEPSARSGFTYTAPVHIDRTTTLRAYAFRDGFAPTNIDTQTYIFLDDVLTQTGTGLPDQWGYFDDLGPARPARIAANYDVDPDVINDARYRDTIRDDLRSIPSLSLVLDPNDLWNLDQGLYANSMSSGSDWERAGSVELINTDGETEFQVNAGVRIHGGWGRRPSQTNKHSFRLLFKREYGPTKLSFPWFGENATDEFDTIVLRAGFNDSWGTGGNTVTTYATDQWVAQAQREMGGISPHSSYVHLYVNGLYWGLYSPTERPNASFAASYNGGNKSEYDAYVTGKLIDGDSVAWNQMFTLLRQNPIDYEAVQQMLDVPMFIDYMIVNQYGGNWDWPHNNWYASRRRTPDGQWQFHSWDAEGVLASLGENRVNSFGGNGPGEVYERLRTVPEFRIAFGDAVHGHMFNDGLLTPQKNIDRLNAIVAEIDRAIVGESARWGDGRLNEVNPARTRDSHWIPRLNTIRTSYFPARGDMVLNQYRGAGLYPIIDAPVFNQHGGTIGPGFNLSIEADRDIYYTLDGSDPRLPGGALSPDAILYDPGQTISLLATGAPAAAWIPGDDSLGATWLDAGFDDSGWIQGTTGVGYERAAGYQDLIGLDVEQQMWAVNSSAFLRVPFTVDDAGTFDVLKLLMKYDDGFVAYINGVEVARANAPDLLEWNADATGAHSDSQALSFEEFDITRFKHLLQPGSNLLAVHGLNDGSVGTDFLILPELQAVITDNNLKLARSTIVKARAVDARLRWSALNEATFLVDPPPALRITEMMYHPADPAPGSPYTDDDFEFIELQNTSADDIHLGGFEFTDGVGFAFPAIDLAPGEYVVVVSNQVAFASRYGVVDNVVGQYTGNLSNSGERVRLSAPFDATVLQFSYDDDWYPETDGDGRSLVIVDAAADSSSWGLQESWRASAAPGGSPGGADAAPVPGDTNGDGVVNIEDLNNVRNNFGGNGLGDANGDGVVNIDDLNLVRNNFGAGAALQILAPARPLPLDPVGLRPDPSAGRPRPLGDAPQRRLTNSAVDLIHAQWRLRRGVDSFDPLIRRASRGHRPVQSDASNWDAALEQLE